MVSLGTIYIQTARDADAVPLWWMDGHSGLLVRAEQLSGSEPAPSSGCGGSDARRVSGTQGDHLVKGSLMDERLRRARVHKGAAVKSRRRGDSAVE